MPTPTGAAKICTLCGQDCSTKPRTKDSKGRYYCQACYQNARAKQEDPRSTFQAGEPDLSNEPAKIFDMLIADKALTAIDASCPRCSRPMPADAALCTNCGYSSTGQVIATNFPAAPSPLTSNPAISVIKAVVWPAWLFRSFALNAPGVVMALIAYAYGVFSVADRTDSRLAMAKLRNNPTFIPDTWSFYWGMAFGTGIVAALVFAAINGWWYRVRVNWCGDTDAEIHTARRVLFTSSIVVTVPAILSKLQDTITYATPSAAAMGDWTILTALAVVALFASIWVSFVGVRTTFDVKTVLAVIWFLIVPGAFYIIVLAVVIGASVLAATSRGGGAGSLQTLLSESVGRPTTFRSNAFDLSYPVNWSIMSGEPWHDPDVQVGFTSPYSSIAVRLALYESDSSPEAEIANTVNQIESALGTLAPAGTFDRWGDYTGAGRIYRVVLEGEEIEIRIFATSMGGAWRFEAQESYPTYEVSNAALEMIRRSARVRTPD